MSCLIKFSKIEESPQSPQIASGFNRKWGHLGSFRMTCLEVLTSTLLTFPI